MPNDTPARQTTVQFLTAARNPDGERLAIAESRSYEATSEVREMSRGDGYAVIGHHTGLGIDTASANATYDRVVNEKSDNKKPSVRSEQINPL